MAVGSRSKFPMKKAADYIPGLGTKYFLKASYINILGGAEKYLPGLGDDFVFDGKDIAPPAATGLEYLEELIPGLGKDFFIYPDDVWCRSNVVMPVVTDGTFTPIADATVWLDDDREPTNAEGLATFYNIKAGVHTYTVEADGYVTQSGTITKPNTSDSYSPVAIALAEEEE